MPLQGLIEQAQEGFVVGVFAKQLLAGGSTIERVVDVAALGYGVYGVAWIKRNGGPAKRNSGCRSDVWIVPPSLTAVVLSPPRGPQ